jgi:transposase-like protein
MEEKTTYSRRSQKDYTLSFKLQVISEVENGELSLTQAKMKYGIQGDSTVRKWLQKYGNFDWEHKSPFHMSKTPEQKILELEAKVKLLEKQNAFLAAQNTKADKKAIIFDMMIDIAEKEYNIEIRKNSSPEQLNNTKKPTKKA